MDFRNPPNISRRSFLHRTAPILGAGALTSTIRDLRLINAAMAQSATTDYKALVCIFLSGGNDANNLIIPTLTDEYANYATIRTPVLALPNTDGSGATALAMNSTNPDGHNYGMNPACPDLRTLFNNGKLASVFNVGTLVYPMTKAQYNANSVPKPPQLFSHSDQVTQWQTSIPDQPPSSGWGGRCADLLDSLNPRNGTLPTDPAKLSLAVSLAGANTLEVGGVVQQYSVSTSGVVALSALTPASTRRDAALKSILGIDKAQADMLVSNYALALDHSVSTGSALSTALASSLMPSTFWGTANNYGQWSTSNTTDAQIITPNGGSTFTSSLMPQLRMIAKIIEAGYRGAGVSNGLGMKRQIFFCQVGGYDTHTNQTNSATSAQTNANVIIGSQANLLAELSQCMNRFQTAISAISTQYGGTPTLESGVTTFTSSDFGRTFPSNSLGSDHGWGSHHLVMGGAVKGGKTYGKFPSLQVGGPDDTSTGRWIPTTSVDQFAATLASWFGVTGSNLNTVFPNLKRFNTPNLGFV
jgi:uncharacterized protein (DUF1501 family)